MLTENGLVDLAISDIKQVDNSQSYSVEAKQTDSSELRALMATGQADKSNSDS